MTTNASGSGGSKYARNGTSKFSASISFLFPKKKTSESESTVQVSTKETSPTRGGTIGTEGCNQLSESLPIGRTSTSTDSEESEQQTTPLKQLVGETLSTGKVYTAKYSMSNSIIGNMHAQLWDEKEQEKAEVERFVYGMQVVQASVDEDQLSHSEQFFRPAALKQLVTTVKEVCTTYKRSGEAANNLGTDVFMLK